MKKDKANSRAGHLMVSDHAAHDPAQHQRGCRCVAPDNVCWAPEPAITWCDTQWHKATTSRRF